MAKNYKKDFPFFERNKKLIYFDNAATAQKPREVLRAIKDFYEGYNANTRRGSYRLAEKATDRFEDARKMVADFLAVEASEIAFTSGTTESINLIVNSLKNQIKKGDEIICLGTEHHSNLLPFRALAEDKGARLKLIFPKNKDLIWEIKDISDNISPKTKLIALAAASNFSGFAFSKSELKEIVRVAKEVGAVTIADGTQIVEHQKINLKEIGVDAFAFSGHKIYGPTGIGVLYVSKNLRSLIKPSKYGGEMVKSVTARNAVYEDFPWIFEAGTPNIEGAIGLAAAIKYIEKIGPVNIERIEKALTKKLLEELAEIPQVEIYGPKSYKNRAPLVSFNIIGLHPHDVGYFLDQKNIAVRTGQHCAGPAHEHLNIPASVRASLAFYNSREEITKFISIIKQLIKKSA